MEALGIMGLDDTVQWYAQRGEWLLTSAITLELGNLPAAPTVLGLPYSEPTAARADLCGGTGHPLSDMPSVSSSS